MTLHRTITKAAAAAGVRVNRVSVPREPWHVEPEPKPEPLRQDRSIYGHTVKTPEVPKPRVPSPDRFSARDQDDLASEWGALCRGEGHHKASPAAPHVSSGNNIRLSVLRLLTRGEDTRDGIATRLPQYKLGTVKSALSDLKHTGHVAVVGKEYGVFVYAITAAGLAMLDAEGEPE